MTRALIPCSARSGKNAYAERLANAFGKEVIHLSTAQEQVAALLRRWQEQQA